MSSERDDLAYGASGSQGTDRGLVGDTFKFLKNKYQQSQHQSQTQPSFGYTEQPSSQGGQQYTPDHAGYNPGIGSEPPYPGGPPPQQSQPRPDTVTSIFNSVHGLVHGVGSGLAGKLGTNYVSQASSHQEGQSGQPSSQAGYALPGGSTSRYGSFASQKDGNDVKWYVDGCGYMFAVSKALEAARESIWILDWWLSPELYLRRPPAKNEPFRVDRMLHAAAQRGVRVNIIVYKEVTQALTRKYLSPTLRGCLHHVLPNSTDALTTALVKLGLKATVTSVEYLENENPLIAPPVTVSSSHTKHALEDLHPNIAVFRHPDHLPDAQTLQSSLLSSFQNLRLNAATASRLGGDALKSIYGITDDVILFWAHHEKLCLVDGKTAFMGGLDLCYGRWDTFQHPIADAHPHDLNAIVFPGQDYNNARIMDFDDVAHWQNNKLDRKTSSRMGWSDVSVSLHGPVVQDLRQHFIDRWNFILDEKYAVRKDARYSWLPRSRPGAETSNRPTVYPQGGSYQQSNLPPGAAFGSGHPPEFPPPPGSEPGSVAYQPHTGPPQSAGPLYDSQVSQPPPRNTYEGQPQGQFYPPPPAGPPPSSQYVSEGQRRHGADQRTPSPRPGYTAELEGGFLPKTTNYPEQPRHYYGSPPSAQPSRTLEEDDQSFSHERGLGGKSSRYADEGRRLKDEVKGVGNMLYGQVEHRLQNARAKSTGETSSHGRPVVGPAGAVPCQIVRSCTTWSNGTATEHSIQNAYIDIIQKSQHFIYIENQFFITATGDSQKPVRNQVGKAIVERILRAARGRERYKVIVLMPSVPAFAGDLRNEDALGTRAIMEFQYNSINRGGNSIMEMISREGVNPMDYIRFYNLRNFDRINAGGMMREAELRSGVNYEDAQRQQDNAVGAGYGGGGERGPGMESNTGPQYQSYQQAAQRIPQGGSTDSSRWDSVSECYMLGGEDIRNVPWDQSGDLSEIDAFVSEELYIHSKVLIADDRVVIAGSANLNDRSQLGTHDSEIAIIIEDPEPVQSRMADRPWQATRFAASLRRQLFRKHLGLLRPQNMERADENFEPVGTPNRYDWGSAEDKIVADPLSGAFESLWNSRAKSNTEVFRKVFHAVPDDTVRNWNDYKEFYEYYFHLTDTEQDQNQGVEKAARYKWGHVVRENFSPGAAGVGEVKELLSRVKGTLVEMPLMFLIEEDIAQEGATLNALTEEVYT